jgi:hypothetical protein
MSHPFENPAVGYGIGAMGAATIAVVALVFIDDQTLRYALLAIAVLDLLVTPQILKRAVQDSG